VAEITDFHLLVRLEPKGGGTLEYTDVVTYTPYANLPDWMSGRGQPGEVLTTTLCK